MNQLTRLAVFVVVLAGSSVAQADPVTFLFNGSIPLDGGGGPNSRCWGEDPLCGSDIFGHLTINDEPASFDQEWAIYENLGFPYGMVIVAGGAVGIFDYVYASVGNDVPSALASCSVADGDDHPCDRLRLSAHSLDLANRFFGFFFDPTGTAIDNNGLMPDPSSFAWGCTQAEEGCILDIGPSSTMWCCEFNWEFHRSPVVIPVFPIPVPEPGTLALFGIGLLGMGLARRRRRLA